ncbi:MAG: hypothetical protein JSS81_06565 [Acidobacteria bacterium]|nr:hypothetical protein [Acidobacteriota bacterium]
MKKFEPQEEKIPKRPSRLVEGVDFYYENGLMVLTAHFLRERGYCCENGCRHCPYRAVEDDE